MAIHACSEAVVKIEHFILTRFNVTSQFTENVPQIDIHSEEYLEKRFSLFRKFCFPSVSRQTGNFKWLVFFSKYTPDRFKEEIETLRRNYMFFCPMYIDDKAIEPKMTKVVMHRMLMETYSPDMAATELQAAQEALSEITGDKADEKLLDRVFSSFCVGK